MINERMKELAGLNESAQFNYDPNVSANGTFLLDVLTKVNVQKLRSLFGKGEDVRDSEKGYDTQYVFKGNINGRNTVFTLYDRWGEWRIGGRDDNDSPAILNWLQQKGII